MLLHYLVKVETPKMHVNTNSAFNINDETEVQDLSSSRDGRPWPQYRHMGRKEGWGL